MAESSQAAATVIAPLAKIAADLSATSGVSYDSALAAMIRASGALERAWDQGVKACINARPWSGPHESENPYRIAR